MARHTEHLFGWAGQIEISRRGRAGAVGERIADDEMWADNPTDTSPWDERGPCWGDPTSADRCAAECAEATALLAQTATDAGVDVGTFGEDGRRSISGLLA